MLCRTEATLIHFSLLSKLCVAEAGAVGGFEVILALGTPSEDRNNIAWRPRCQSGIEQKKFSGNGAVSPFLDLLLHNSVAFAGSFFQAGPVDDSYVSASVSDETGSLQNSRRDGYAGAARA